MADLRASGLGGVPKGATADRPASPSIGDVFYNGTLGCLEIYTSAGWVANSAPPAVPVINSISQSNSAATYAATSSASVAFTAGTGGGLPNSYLITSNPGNISQSGASSPIVLSGLTNGTQYTFSMTATNNFNTSVSSTTSSTFTPSTKPQAPTIGEVLNLYNGNQISVAYTAGATGGAATTYTATSSPGGFTATGASPITVSGLTNGTAYTFTVTATNANGSSQSSASSSVTALAVVPSDYLVVAGGGGGGFERVTNAGGGGGGAGGFRTSAGTSGRLSSAESQVNFAVGSTYTVQVGGGGAGGIGSSTTFSTNGVNSYISGSGITTITSLGGGHGSDTYTGTSSDYAGNGGSGGGGTGDTAGAYTGGLGTTGQGFNGGSTGTQVAAGGGGAGAVGQDAQSTVSGAGGTGITSTITGASVNYAGGGGGGAKNGGSGGAANSGGASGGNNGDGNNAAANFGGGGGGAGTSYPTARSGGSGGSGIVVIKAVAAAASTTGSPTYTNPSTGVHIYKFTGTGSITF
jgi:hypothetical protein